MAVRSDRLIRIMRILTALQAEKGCNANELAKIAGTSRRTVFRDMKVLQEAGMHFQYDIKSGSYTADPEYFLPPINLSLREAMSILLLAHKAADQMQLPFKKSAILAALKIDNILPLKIRMQCDTALQNVTTMLAATAPLNELDKIFALFQKAVRLKRKVHIRYKSLYDRKTIELTVHPYHLMYNHRAWYVLGWSSVHKSVRTFKLNRIKQFQLLEKCFLSKGKFDLYDYLGKAWSMIPEGQIYNVKLRFLPKVAENVTEVHWHSTQKVSRNADGSVTMEFRVDGLGEIFWWILGYGDQVEILSPARLRKKVRQAAENIMKLNA